jgi:hypothetical protein
MLQRVTEEFMKNKFKKRNLDINSSLVDPKSGGLVSVAKIIEEIKEKEEKAKEEERSKSP